MYGAVGQVWTDQNAKEIMDTRTLLHLSQKEDKVIKE